MTKKMPNVTIYGDGSQKSIITGNKNFADGVRTFQTASFGMAQQIFHYYACAQLNAKRFNAKRSCMECRVLYILLIP